LAFYEQPICVERITHIVDVGSMWVSEIALLSISS
jgi:hypothetical protein